MIKWDLLAKCLLLYFIYSVGVDLLYMFMEDTPSSFGWYPPSLQSLFETSLITPLWEEAVYRYSIIEVGREFERRGRMKIMMPLCIGTSLIFGFYHNEDIPSILYQGVFGGMLCFAYIKSGYSYWNAVILHSVWNTIILLFYGIN